VEEHPDSADFKSIARNVQRMCDAALQQYIEVVGKIAWGEGTVAGQLN
jgi:hypothetical protein